MRPIATALVVLATLAPAAAQTTSWDASTGVWTFDGSAVAVTVEVVLTCDGGLLALNGTPEAAPCADLQHLDIQTGPGDDVVELGASFVPGSSFSGSTIAVGDGDNTVALADRNDAPAEITGGTGETTVSASVGTVSVRWDVGSGSKYTVEATGTALVDAYLRGTDNLDQLSCLVSDPAAERVFVGWPDVQSGVEMPAMGRVEVDLGGGDDLWSNRTCLGDVGGVTFDVDGGDGDDRVTITGSVGDDQFTIGAGTPACAGVAVELSSDTPTALQTCLSDVEGYELYGNGGDTEIVGDPASTLADALVGTTWFVLPSGAFTASGLGALGPVESWEAFLVLAESCDLDLPVAGSAEFLINMESELPCRMSVPEGGRVDPIFVGAGHPTCSQGSEGASARLSCSATAISDGSPLPLALDIVTPGETIDPDASVTLNMAFQLDEALGPIRVNWVVEAEAGAVEAIVRLLDDHLEASRLANTMLVQSLDTRVEAMEIDEWSSEEVGSMYAELYGEGADGERELLTGIALPDGVSWAEFLGETGEGVNVLSGLPSLEQLRSFESGSGTNRGGPGDTLFVASGGASYTDDGSTIVVEGHGPIHYAGFGVVEVRDDFPTAAEPVAQAEGLRLTARPNPSAGAIALDLALDHAGPVRITVLDMLGRAVARVWDGPLGVGAHTLAWDAAAAAPGVYAVRVETDRQETALLVTLAR